MFRLLMLIAAVLFVVVWFLFIKAMLVLIVVGIVMAGVWIWWEIHELRKAMRTPPGG